MTWRHHIERTVAKALRTYIKTYSLFKRKCLSTNLKLKLHRALIRSVKTYAFPTCVYVAEAKLLKLQRLQSRVLCVIGNIDRCTPVRELHVAFKIAYISILCSTQAIEIYVVVGKEKPCIGTVRGLNFAAVRLTTIQLTKCSFRVLK
jgi:hypothetical protein